MYRYPNCTFPILVAFLFLSFQLLAQSNKIDQSSDLSTAMKESAALSKKDPEVAILKLKKLRDENIKSNPQKAVYYVCAIIDVLGRNKGDNHELLKESEIGLQLATELNDYKSLTFIYQYRSFAYMSAGLLDQCYRELVKAIPYTKKIRNSNSKNIALTELYDYISLYYEQINDTGNERLYLNKSIATSKLITDSSKMLVTKARLFEHLGKMFYKNKQFDSSEFYLLEAYKLRNHITTALYPYDKALVFVYLSNFYYQQKDYRKAIQYAQIGLKIKKETKLPQLTKNFYNVLFRSYLETNQIDSSKYFSKLYYSMQDSLEIATKSGLNTTIERQNKTTEIAHAISIKKIIMIGVSILIILSMLTLYWIRISRKRLHQKYEDLITKIKQEAIDQPIETYTSSNLANESTNDIDADKNTNDINVEESTNSITTEERSNKEGIYIPEETVAILLKKLDKFERSAKYIKKNITLSSMAIDLNTNTRYISEIIKEYRKKNFNNYINGLRIEFITKKLYEDPQFRKYKVAYLAEYSGFSSGINFTYIFKKETGMTPSYFINQLEKQD